MTSAGEVFVVALARASRRANRFLRHLQRADRNEVLSMALLWCWEHRENYSLTTSLDTWFINAVRDAYRAWQAGEKRNSVEQLNEIPTGDTTLATAEAIEAAEKLVRSLPVEYKRVAELHARGHTRAEMLAQGISKDTIDNTRARIKQMRRLLPSDHEYRRVLRAAPTSSDVFTEAVHIDRELERLDFPPPAGAECPPCWRCKWFEGYLPGDYRPTRMQIQEPEVRDAVRDTEARKIEIANEVRRGNL